MDKVDGFFYSYIMHLVEASEVVRLEVHDRSNIK